MPDHTPETAPEHDAQVRENGLRSLIEGDWALTADASRFLLARLDESRAALSEAQKDSERLDWLDTTGREHGRLEEVGYQLLHNVATIREAIDEAIKFAAIIECPGCSESAGFSVAHLPPLCSASRSSETESVAGSVPEREDADNG